MLCGAITRPLGLDLTFLCPDLLAVPQYKKRGVGLVPPVSVGTTSNGETRLACDVLPVLWKLVNGGDFLNLIFYSVNIISFGVNVYFAFCIVPFE